MINATHTCEDGSVTNLVSYTFLRADYFIVRFGEVLSYWLLFLTELHYPLRLLHFPSNQINNLMKRSYIDIDYTAQRNFDIISSKS